MFSCVSSIVKFELIAEIAVADKRIQGKSKEAGEIRALYCSSNNLT